jgi:hypothetical protein
MSQVLTVPTHFNDIGELSEGFLDRVEQDTLILYGPVAYEEGAEIEFSVMLADGTAAIEGAGRVRASVDGGDDRVPETRYDIVVEALVLDARSAVVFESLVVSRQAVSDVPPGEEAAPVTSDMDAPPEAEVAEVESDEVFSLAPDEEAEFASTPDTVPPEASDEEAEFENTPDTVPPEASDEEEAFASTPDTVPPEAYDDEDEEEDDPPTVISAVDAESIMAEAMAAEADTETDADMDAVADTELETVSGEEVGYDVEEFASQFPSEPAATLEAEATSELEAQIDSEATNELPQDSMYAFEHGIAAEPQVGMPVPIPSMAAPPEAPPAPPRLRLAETPEGLTRPSLAQPEDPLFSVDGEVSDVHTTGLFSYEEGLPIPERPPLPDPNRAKQVALIEAANDYDVEESEPPELLAEDYEEVRLSDFAEAAEEG